MTENMTTNDFDLAIVGAGITGLSAAYYGERSTSAQHPMHILVLEEGSRVGGKIRTERKESAAGVPFLLEHGADSMLSTKPAGIELALALGLENEIIETGLDRQVYVLKGNRMIAMPEGLMLVVPKRLLPFLKSPLFSLFGKLRMGLDIFLPKRKVESDESIGSFIRRRLGNEALDFLAEPILSGIYSADPDRQSLEATFGQLKEMERQHRSLIIGAMRSSAGVSTGKRTRSIFVSFKNGMQTLIDVLERAIKSEIRLNTNVSSITSDIEGGWRIALSNGDTFTARHVLLTTASPVTARLLHDAAPEASEILEQHRLASSGCAYFAYRKEDVAHALKGYGLLIPKTQNRSINAVTWVSSKMQGRSPDSHVLFRIFFGGERNRKLMELDDSEIKTLLSAELAQLHGISGPADLCEIYRWENGNPQYDVGHMDRIKKAETLLPKGISVIGCGMRGVGIPDCIRQAKEFVLQREKTPET